MGRRINGLALAIGAPLIAETLLFQVASQASTSRANRPISTSGLLGRVPNSSLRCAEPDRAMSRYSCRVSRHPTFRTLSRRRIVGDSDFCVTIAVCSASWNSYTQYCHSKCAGLYATDSPNWLDAVSYRILRTIPRNGALVRYSSCTVRDGENTLRCE